MQQMFQSTVEGLYDLFREAWESSVQVAVISKVLAQQVSHLDAEQAMLAGLIHNPGVLPIVIFYEEQHEAVPDGIDLASLVDAVSQSGNFYRDHQEKADYAGLVIVARMQSAANGGHLLAEIDWNNVSVFQKLGIDPELSIIDI